MPGVKKQTVAGVKLAGHSLPTVPGTGARPGSGGVAVRLWARPTRERWRPRGGACAGKGGPKGAGRGLREAVRWRCVGSWRQRCSTAGKPRWAPPSPSPSFFSWQRPTSGASYRAQPLPFAYVQPRRAARVGARSRRASRLSACVSVCVWRECEQRESRPTARAGVGSYSGLPSSSGTVTLPGLAQPWHRPELPPGSVPAPARSRMSGRGRGPRSP